MFPVTDEYLAAQRAPFREERITGTVQLRDGTFIAVSNDTIVQGSLSITRQAFRSDKFDIGMLSSAIMNIRIKDDRAYDHEFSGARVSLIYGIVTSETEDGIKRWYSVPLPPFYVDGHGSRQRNYIKLTAYDPVRLLSVAAPSDIPTGSLYAALSYVCGNCGVTLGMVEKEFDLLPNSGVIPDFSSESIETCADVVMWIAQTVNCCAFCNYSGQLVFRQYYYEGGDNYDYLFTAARRTKIEYGDTRTYLAYLQSYVGGDVKIYSNVIEWTGTDAPHTKEGSMALPKNPVLKNLTADQQDEVNRSYLALKNRGFATRYVKSTGFVDPVLEPLDVVAFSGGSIDVGQIISVATKIVWKFRGNGTVYCTNVSENGETASSASWQSGGIAVYSAGKTAAAQARISPKSQLEKRVDELESLAAAAPSTSIFPITEYKYISDDSVMMNGMTYTAEKDAETGLISKISDSNGNSLEPEISAGITNAALHNAVFWAVAMARGISVTADLVLFTGLNGQWQFGGGLTGFTKRGPESQDHSGLDKINCTSGAAAAQLSKSYGPSNSIDGRTNAVVIQSNEKIDLTKYNRLRIQAVLFRNYSSLTGSAYFRTGAPAAVQSGTAYDFSGWVKLGDCDIVSQNYAAPGTPVWYEVDISQLSGAHYLSFGVSHGAESLVYTTYMDIHQIVLSTQ